MTKDISKMRITGPLVDADKEVRRAYDLWVTGELPQACMVDDVWTVRDEQAKTKNNSATPDQPFEDIWEEGYLGDQA